MVKTIVTLSFSTLSLKLMFYYICFIDIFFFTAVRGQWTPLVELVEPCGFTLDGQDGELNIAAPFITCGIAVMVNFRGSPVMVHDFHCSYSANWMEVKYLIF